MLAHFKRIQQNVDPIRESKAVSVACVGAGLTFIHLAKTSAQWWGCFFLGAVGVVTYVAVSIYLIARSIDDAADAADAPADATPPATTTTPNG